MLIIDLHSAYRAWASRVLARSRSIVFDHYRQHLRIVRPDLVCPRLRCPSTGEAYYLAVR